MKRILYFLLITVALSMLTLQACAGGGGSTQSAGQQLIPPEVSMEPASTLLVGAAGSGSGATVPALCEGAEDTNTSSFAQQVVQLVNDERAAAGVAALTSNTPLMNAAQKHSIDMACNAFFSHTGSDGSTPFTRMVAFGYNYVAAAENVAAGYMTPEEVVAGWMDSPDHRANMLNAAFTEIGIGYVYNSVDTQYFYDYWTMDLGDR